MPVWELNDADMETLRPLLSDRCQQAVRKYALYLLDNGSTARKAWAKDNMANLASLGEQMTHYVTSEPTFIAGGTSITDTALQSRIETVLNTYILPA